MKITRLGTINYKINCETCGEVMYRSARMLKRNKQHFCSVGCKVSEGRFMVECGYCGKELSKHRYQEGRSDNYFCGIACKGRWMSGNLTNEKGQNWRGGTWNNRVQVLAHTHYRTWRAKILDGAVCILCGTDEELELHHIISKIVRPDLVKSEENVVPICAPEHDKLHSNSRKGGELRGHLNDILSHGNPQPSRSNVLDYVGRKVQRLTGEDAQSDKPDTSAAPERDDIVRACPKG